MTVTNSQSGTNIQEIEAGIYRINTPVPEMPGGFSFNQYLVVDDEPLLFHTGPRAMFPLVSQAIGHVLPIDRLRWLAYSHFEADECGAMNELLAVAPQAQGVCSSVGAMVSGNDFANRPVRGMADGEVLVTGRRSLRWLDMPHLPHGWDCGFFYDETSRTLFSGDLFTQPGAHTPALTEGDILGPSEAFRGAMDYYSHTKNLKPLMEKLCRLEPRTLACMHGSAWRGDGAKLLRALGDTLDGALV
ncbi:MAG TPA: FprA family A-type flavoprotein [Polyangiaceae bacterium]|nr:FprA family A-type flavoprotein [Polyangiaceae bacterium]